MTNQPRITIQPEDEKRWAGLREVLQIVNMERTAFYYHVDKPDGVRSKQGKNKRDKLYNMADVKRLKAKQENWEIIYETDLDAAFADWLYATDVIAGLKLAQKLYGPEVDLASAATYQSWRKHNDRISIAVFSKDRSECFASMQVLPLPENVILDILSSKREEASIQPDEVQTYDAPGPYTLLVTNVAVLPEKPELLYKILFRYMEFWIEQYPERYIKKVYAQAASRRGVQLIQHFFMTPRRDLAYNAYEVDMAVPSASKVIQKFQRKLESKAPLPLDLQWPPVEAAQVEEREDERK